VLAGQQARDHLLLEWAELSPAQAVDHVVLNSGM
jgi:hypothetical protein